MRARSPVPVGMLLLSATLVAGCAIQQDHERMARVFLQGETAAETLAPAANDFRIWFDDTTTTPISRDHFYDMIQWDAALHARTDIRRMRARRGTVVADIHSTNDLAELLGHPGWGATMTFWFDGEDDGGLISEALHVPDADNPALEPYLEEAMPYLRAHHAETLAKVYPKGQMLRTPESARAWRRILTDWRASHEPEAAPDAGAGAGERLPTPEPSP